MEIKKAILNILDFTHQKVLFGSKEINVSEEGVVNYLLPLLKKGFVSNKAKSFVLVDSNPMMNLINEYKKDKKLNVWANDVTQKVFNYMKRGAFNTVMDFIAFEIEDAKGDRHLGFGICEEKTAFKPLVSNDEINIEVNQSIGNTLQYFVSINLKSNQVRVIESKTEYDGEIINLITDKIFNSGSFPAEEETFKALKKAIVKVSDAYESTGIDELAKLYNFMGNNAEVDETLNVSEAIDRAFKGEPAKAADAKQTLQDLNMLETLPMPKDFVSKKTEKIKIKTDTGIELSVPQEYILTNDYVEFLKKDDGTIEILIKGIIKISHK